MDNMNGMNQNEQQQQQYVGNTYDNQQVQQEKQAQQQNGYIQTPGSQPNYQQQNYQQQNYQQGYQQGYQQQGIVNQYMTWLIAGAVQVLCLCCCCSWMSLITGIMTIVFAVLANQAYNSNDQMAYYKNIKIAKISNIVGWVLLLVGIVINMVAGIFANILNTISNNIQ